MNVKGKRAIVFGGTSGIGLATSLQLAEQGAEVIAVSRNPERASDLPETISLRSCDVLDRTALQQLFQELAPFDILVSTATGGARVAGPFLEMDMDAFQASFAKLWGYTHVVRYGAQHLTERGTIVLVSGAPARKTRPGQVALGTVGGGVEAFVRAITAELAPRRINLVSPGVIETPIFGEESDERAELLKNVTENSIIPRPGQPDEVAQAIMFAIENEFVTGTTIDVDGGWLLS